jgi:glycosyltransferase involved in cell wall biosynthesis
MSDVRPLLTCAVLARDVADVLDDCLTSISFADEVLVLVDAATRDATREIARRRGAHLEERVFDSFAGQRDAALELARGDWVLFVDADERVTPELRAEVLDILQDPHDCRGFWIPRANVLLGRVVRHAGWWPDYQLRLVQRGAAQYDPRRVVHELPIVDGTVGHLQHPFVHLNYRSIGEFIFKQERYCRLDARRWLLTYGRPRARALAGQPLREFWRRYVTLQGFKEGPLGLLLCLLLAYYAGKAIWLARSAGSRPQLGDGGELAHANQKLG